MGAKERNRGSAFEREVCQRLSAKFGYPVKRKLGQARDSGNDIDAGPLRIECKRRRAIAVYAWLDQILNQEADPDRLPVVVARADGRRSIAILDFEDLLALIPDGSEKDQVALDTTVEVDENGPGPAPDARGAGKVVSLVAFVRKSKGTDSRSAVRHGQHGRSWSAGSIRPEAAAVG